MRQFGWVSAFRKIASALCSLKPATQRNFRRRPPRSHFLSCRRASARQRALNQEASRWNPGIFRHPRGTEEYLFDHVPRLWCRQSFAKKGDRPVHVSIENFSKQLLLIAKRSVKTWSIDSHDACEIRERSAFVAFGPKDVHGTIQGRVGIKGARPSKGCRGF